ncbi:MAG: hypothetical protein LBE56_06365 [Tannerella sp.]|jgi:hypothetical protein|nr:hypothetical protein [Tannerella sp.]
MMKYFLASSLILLLVGCATTSVASRNTDVSPAAGRLWSAELRDDGQMNRYNVDIQVRGNHITGLCMLKKTDEGWRGTVINEFGVKAFDFTVTTQQCKLLNVISMLNKWYIRRTIADDLHFLFEIDNPDAGFQRKTTRAVQSDGTMTATLKRQKSIVRNPDNSLVLNNLKRKIIYSLNVINE